jgi:glycosyltransferase involved in cell wall biosynthesis
MAARKLLILTYHFPPSAAAGGFRMLGFAQHLPAFGWHAVVVAPPRLPGEPSDPALFERVPRETALCYVDYPSRWPWKPFTKFFGGAAWLPFAAAGCYRAIRHYRPHAVLSSGPPHHVHLLGRHLHRWIGLPWVADFRDPWVAGDRSAMTWQVASWEKRAEPSVILEADAIIANTPAASNILGEAYPEHSPKIVSITNGYDAERFLANSIRPLAHQTVEIAHLGEIYANRDPEPFLKAIRGLMSDDTPSRRAFRIRFIGRLGAAQQQINYLIRTEGLESVVELGGQVAYDESLRVMLGADVLLLLDSPGRRTGVPAKLYEYIGARRPILALAEQKSDVAWVLRESGLPHRVAPPRDAEAIRCALGDLLQDPAVFRCGTPNEPSPARFTRRHLAGELASLLDSCVQSSPSCEVGKGLRSEAVR